MASIARFELDHSAGKGLDAAAAGGGPCAGGGSGRLTLRAELNEHPERFGTAAGAGPAEPEEGDRENLRLLRWTRREAPEIIEILQSAYLTGAKGLPALLTAAYHRIVKPAAAPAGAAVKAVKLKDVEREHLRKVLAESGTVAEAARRLGIDATTLWRKRKRYRLIEGQGPPA